MTFESFLTAINKTQKNEQEKNMEYCNGYTAKEIVKTARDKRMAISYDDVTMAPQYSSVDSRKNIDVKPEMGDNVSDISISNPIMAAPMDTVCGPRMALAMEKAGSGAVIHRTNDHNIYKRYKDAIDNEEYTIKQEDGTYRYYGETFNAFVAVGLKDVVGDVKYLKNKYGFFKFCIDTAYAQMGLVHDAVSKLRKEFGDEIEIMTGNYATVPSEDSEAFDKLLSTVKMSDYIRVGVGGGSVCSTRIETGHGTPNLTSIIGYYSLINQHGNDGKYKTHIIADGGIRSAGDMVKALSFGADFVMIGGLLSSTHESPRGVEHRGMASKEAQMSWRGEEAVSNIEGVSAGTNTHYKKESAVETVSTLVENIQSGCSYANASNLKELKKNARFHFQSNAGVMEAKPHATI